MVFDAIKKKLLEAELKRIKGSSGKNTLKAKVKLKKILTQKEKEGNIIKAKLKAEAELKQIQSQIKKAKQLNLTPTEKKLLLDRQLARKKKIAKYSKNLKDTSKVLGNAILDGLKLVAQKRREGIEKREKFEKAAAKRTKKRKR